MPGILTPKGPLELGSFTELIRPEGRYLNDHCLICEGDMWHFFGIVGPVGKSCFTQGSETSFAHFVSPDLRAWTACPDVLEVEGTWPDTDHVFAPNVMKKDGVFYMLYAGLDAARVQRMCLATSPDLYAWTRHPGNPVIVPSLSWAAWPGFSRAEDDMSACRDAHILQLPEGGYIAYWVAEMNDRCGPDATCVAASLSRDLVHWQELGPVFLINRWDDGSTAAAESPCVVCKDGWYWLFFKHGWCTHVARSRTPYTFMNAEPVRLGYAHAAEVFAWKGEWWITHCSSQPQDYRYRTGRTRGLYLARLLWPDGAYPRFEA